MHPSNDYFMIFLIFWLLSANFIIFSYECNLRANIVKVAYEKPINTEQDVYDAGLELYLPLGTATGVHFRDSVVPIKQKLYKRAMERDTLFVYINGAMPQEIMKRVVKTGLFNHNYFKLTI
jgi:hypothetical protein